MEKTIEIPEGYEARIEGNKVILEPKESEDEKIRKAIESIIRVYGKTQGEWIAGYDMDTLVVHLRDAFACLEKQKEQKPESCDCSRDEESYMNGIHHVLMNPEAYGLIKQKPASISYNHENDSKPTEWSEEDEKFFKTALWHISYSVSNGKTTDDHCDTTHWLKGVKERLKILCPSWKPSEEQMKTLKCLPELLRNFKLDSSARMLEVLYEQLKEL